MLAVIGQGKTMICGRVMLMTASQCQKPWAGRRKPRDRAYCAQLEFRREKIRCQREKNVNVETYVSAWVPLLIGWSLHAGQQWAFAERITPSARAAVPGGIFKTSRFQLWQHPAPNPAGWEITLCLKKNQFVLVINFALSFGHIVFLVFPDGLRSWTCTVSTLFPTPFTSAEAANSSISHGSFSLLPNLGDECEAIFFSV